MPAQHTGVPSSDRTRSPTASAVDALADRFWEALLELNPDDRDGLRRRALRGPAGGSGTGGPGAGPRSSWSAPLAEAQAIPTDGLPTEERITRDMLRVVGRAQHRGGRPAASTSFAVVDQMGGPQQLLPAADAVPAGRHARSGSRPSSPGSTPIAALHGRQPRDPRDGIATGPDRTADRDRADDRPDRAHARGAASSRRSCRRWSRSRATPTASACARSSATWCIRPTRRSSTPCAATYLPASREEPGLWSAPNGDALYRTAIRSWTTLELDPEEVHQIGLEELDQIDVERRAHRRRGRATATTRLPTAPALDADPANTPTDQGRAGRAGRARTSSARWPLAPKYFGAPAAGGLRGPAGRGVQGEGRARSPTTTRRPLDGSPPGHLLRERLRPAEPHLHEARHHHLPRGRSRAPLPDRARDGEPAPQHVPATRRAHGRRRVRRGLGPVQRAARRRDGPVPRRGRALRHARRPGLARGAPRRRHRAPRAALDAPAVDRLPAHAGLSETDAVIETDRYICWPGQALTYKVGQREIERLRAELTARDGVGVRPASVPRRRPRPRLAAAGDARARAPDLGGHPGLRAAAQRFDVAQAPRGGGALLP